jgi:hypothetical protein
MSYRPVTPALFGAHALPCTSSESHARAGNHLRLHHHPLFGLPVAPFIIERAVMDSPKPLRRRHNAVRFYTASGVEITPPFNVHPDSPVTARIATRPFETCIWAELLAYTTPSSTGMRTHGFGAGPAMSLPMSPPEPAPVLHVTAFLTSALGPAPIGSRSGPPFAFSGPGLVELLIQGSGTVNGLDWVEQRDEQRLDYAPFMVLSLPHQGGPRYLGLPNAATLADLRVREQSPYRRPLQDCPQTPPPFAAPPHSTTDELARVHALVDGLATDLDQLIRASGPLGSVTSSEPIFDETGRSIGSMSQALLHRIQQQQGDPGTATHLGYKTLDTGMADFETPLVFYRITGWFAAPPPPTTAAERLLASLLALLPPENRSIDPAKFETMLDSMLAHQQLRTTPESRRRFSEPGPFIGATCIAIADRRAPLDPMEPPAITRATSQEWLPGRPGRRSIGIGLAGVFVGGLLAAQKRTPPAAFATTTLNRRTTSGWHLPIMLSLSGDPAAGPSPRPGTGLLTDDDADGGPIGYAVAQQDRFGRFSGWASRTAAAAVRPLPPRADVTGYYTPAPVASAATSGGTILIHIPVPRPATLAPGSHPLREVRLTLRDERLGTTTTLTLAASTAVTAGTQLRIELTRTGPILDPTEVRFLTLQARWIDTASQEGPLSEPFPLRLHDLRPPPQLSLPDRLQYSARPDVTGLAIIEHRWQPVPGQASFGVYYTDETRMRAQLASLGAPGAALLAELDAAPDAAARATIWRRERTRLPDHIFERLDGVVRETSGGGRAFRHPVSGSLRVLSAYKIAAESASGARPLLAGLDLLLFGVPNADPPPRPLLSLSPTDPVDTEPPIVVAAEIRIQPGASIGHRWRLRRTATATANPLTMPVVAEGPLPPPDPATGEQHITVRDSGPLLIAPDARLRPWMRYAWTVEVQAPPESGSVAAGAPVPGLWSPASNPVSLVIVPPQPPAAPSALTLSGTPASGSAGPGLANVSLAVSHPGPLQGGVLGAFRVRLVRQRPDQPPEVFLEQDIAEAGDFTLAVSATGEVLPAGTRFTLTLFDPVGRASPPASATLTLVTP